MGIFSNSMKNTPHVWSAKQTFEKGNLIAYDFYNPASDKLMDLENKKVYLEGLYDMMGNQIIDATTGDYFYINEMNLINKGTGNDVKLWADGSVKQFYSDGNIVSEKKVGLKDGGSYIGYLRLPSTLTNNRYYDLPDHNITIVGEELSNSFTEDQNIISGKKLKWDSNAQMLYDGSNFVLTGYSGVVALQSETHLYVDVKGCFNVRDRDDSSATLFQVDTDTRNIYFGSSSDGMVTTHYGDAKFRNMKVLSNNAYSFGSSSYHMYGIYGKNYTAETQVSTPTIIDNGETITGKYVLSAIHHLYQAYCRDGTGHYYDLYDADALANLWPVVYLRGKVNSGTTKYYWKAVMRSSDGGTAKIRLYDDSNGSSTGYEISTTGTGFVELETEVTSAMVVGHRYKIQVYGGSSGTDVHLVKSWIEERTLI